MCRDSEIAPALAGRPPTEASGIFSQKNFGSEKSAALAHIGVSGFSGKRGFPCGLPSNESRVGYGALTQAITVTGCDV